MGVHSGIYAPLGTSGGGGVPASVDAFRNLMVLAKGKVRAEIELPGITDYDLANVLIGIVEAVYKTAGYRGE